MNYCTADAVTKRVSLLGVELRTDNEEHVADAAMEQSLEMGSSELDFYLLPRYTAAEIAANGWAKTAAIIFCVFHLCWLRLNSVPEVVEKQVERWREMLEEIRTGSAILPGTAEGPACGPEVINSSVRLDAYPSVFVDKARSVSSDRTYPERTGREWVVPPRV